jgi:hypothetical protein
MDEEVVLLEEQLAAANAELEQLHAQLSLAQATAEGSSAETDDLRRQLSIARDELAQRESALSLRDEETQTLRDAVDVAAEEARGAAARYRDVVLAAEPDLPADLVVGDTVGEIDLALVRARQTVAQVRQHLEQQAQTLRVPSGAPARGGPDPSSLTPAEKIRLGLRST